MLKNAFILATGTLLLVGCGDNEPLFNFTKIDKPGARGEQGQQGQQGQVGGQGATGQNGLNSLVSVTRSAFDIDVCSSGLGIRIDSGLDLNADTTLQASEVQASSVVCDGTSAALAIDSIIDPCGDSPGIYDEVILKLSDGRLLASFSDNANGQNTRFSLLTAGSYVTTDSSHCSFTIDAAGNLTNEHF